MFIQVSTKGLATQTCDLATISFYGWDTKQPFIHHFKTSEWNPSGETMIQLGWVFWISAITCSWLIFGMFKHRSSLQWSKRLIAVFESWWLQTVCPCSPVLGRGYLVAHYFSNRLKHPPSLYSYKHSRSLSTPKRRPHPSRYFSTGIPPTAVPI